MPAALHIRPVRSQDAEALWSVLEPVIRAGETYPVPRDMTREAALDYWLSPNHVVHVACDEEAMLGTYYLRANNAGGGAHVANCGYMVARGAEGRGVARAMCAHSFELARAKGFRAMQFNFVIASNTRAARLWQSMGFTIMCRLPGVFAHPSLGYVDAFVMFRDLLNEESKGAAR